ncbi:Hat1-like acetyltransferase [Cryptosporidium ryanae]|uniref:Hat1-like acetyltransferase n=1 Tax=Cryptosporidium ryanae TaxID=515981 RepID=UPI00351A40B1|nr:Hat1-like acetyltransferase [Cryptosporidium ryanae]
MADLQPIKKARLTEESVPQVPFPRKISSVLKRVFFHQCMTPEDLIGRENEKTFNPHYAHHFFPDEEISLLEGYETYIHIYYSCNWFDVYVDVEVIQGKNTCKENAILSDEVKQDYINEIIKQLRTVSLEGEFCSREEFIERIKIDLVLMPGVTIDKFSNKLNLGENVKVQLRKVDLAESENLLSILNRDSDLDEKGVFYEEHPVVKNFQTLHRRIEWFLHWYIESASSIDQEDRWTIWLPVIVKEKAITIMGIITTYLFFSMPKCRMRISQVLIFPQYQGKGFGYTFLDAIYQYAIKNDDIMEITVEDPAPSMMQLRDIVGIEILIRNHFFKKGSFKPLEDSELLKILENSKDSLSVLREITLSIFPPSQEWEDLKEKIHKLTKESPRQIARILVLIAFFKYFPEPLPKPQFIDNDENRGLRMSFEGKSLYYNKRGIYIHLFSFEHLKTFLFIFSEDETGSLNLRKDPERQIIDKLFRIAVKKRILADNSDSLFGISQSEMVQNLEYAWKQAYISFYISVKKIRSQYI